MASLVGVVLIARPQFLFGIGQDEVPIPPDDLIQRVLANDVEPAHRVIAVGYVTCSKLVIVCSLNAVI